MGARLKNIPAVVSIILLTIMCLSGHTAIGKNVALSSNGAQATAKNYGTYNGNAAVPAKAIDGDPSTKWGGKGTDKRINWLQVKFDRSYTVNKAAVDIGSHSLTYLIELSSDGSNWDAVASNRHIGTREDPSHEYKSYSFSPTQARYARILIVKTNAPSSHIWQYIIDEFAVYASGGSEPPSNRPPNANFDWKPDSPRVGQEVTFTARSTDPDGTIADREWGDFHTPTIVLGPHKTVSTTYSTPGDYNICLTVTDNDGASDKICKTITIRRKPNTNEEPNAAFSYSPKQPEVGQTVTFQDQSTDPDGSISSWQWVLGDKRTATRQNPSRQYSKAGKYSVCLTVTDNNGATDIACKSFTVKRQSNKAPTADFTWRPSDPTTEDTVKFQDRSSDPNGQIVSRQWDFGDGNSSSSRNPSHTYSRSDSYSVCLTVRDNDGGSDETCQMVSVSAPEPEPRQYQVCVEAWGNGEQRLDATVQVDPLPNGGPSTITTLKRNRWCGSYAYDDTINFTAPDSLPLDSGELAFRSWAVMDTNGNVLQSYRKRSINVTVQRRLVLQVWYQQERKSPNADFTWQRTGQRELEYQFTDQSNDPDGTIEEWSWKFGDGRVSSEQNPIHQFTNARTFTVCLTVTDNQGLTDETCQDVNATELADDWADMGDDSYPIVLTRDGSVQHCNQVNTEPLTIECTGKIRPGTDTDMLQLFLEKGQSITATLNVASSLDADLLFDMPQGEASRNPGKGVQERIEVEELSNSRLYTVGITHCTTCSGQTGEWNLTIALEGRRGETSCDNTLDFHPPNRTWADFHAKQNITEYWNTVENEQNKESMTPKITGPITEEADYNAELDSNVGTVTCFNVGDDTAILNLSVINLTSTLWPWESAPLEYQIISPTDQVIKQGTIEVNDSDTLFLNKKVSATTLPGMWKVKLSSSDNARAALTINKIPKPKGPQVTLGLTQNALQSGENESIPGLFVVAKKDTTNARTKISLAYFPSTPREAYDMGFGVFMPQGKGVTSNIKSRMIETPTGELITVKEQEEQRNTMKVVACKIFSKYSPAAEDTCQSVLEKTRVIMEAVRPHMHKSDIKQNFPSNAVGSTTLLTPFGGEGAITNFTIQNCGLDSVWVVLSMKRRQSEDMQSLYLEVPVNSSTTTSGACDVSGSNAHNQVSNVSANTSIDQTITVQQRHNTVSFVAKEKMSHMKVEIYDLSGRKVATRETKENTLKWHMQNSNGHFVSNGIYLYKLEGIKNGESIYSQVRKIAIVR